MRKPLKIALIALGALLVVVAGVLVLALGWLRGESGRAWLVAQIEAASDPADGTGVTIAVLEGDPLSRMTLRELVVSDAEGPWLTAASVEFAWTPRSLLAGHLELRQLLAADVRLLRQPRFSEPAEEATVATPIDPTRSPLPVDLSVAELAITPLTLDESFLGEPAVLAVAGSLGSRAADELRTRLTIERRDQVQGTLQADVTYRLSDRRLQASLELDEPTGGLARMVSGLDQAGAARVTLEGEGPLDELSGRLSASIEGLGTLETGIGIAIAEPLALTLEGTAEVAWRPPGVPPGLLRGPLAFQAEAALADGRHLRIGKLELDNAAAGISASGSLDLAGLEVDADAQLTVKDQALLDELAEPLSLREPALTLSAAGPLARPRLSLDASLESLAGPAFTAGATKLTLDLGARDGEAQPFTLRAELTEAVQSVVPDLQPLIEGALVVEAEGKLDLPAERVTLDRAVVSSAQLELSAAGGVGFAGDLELETALTLKRLASLAPLVGLEIAGSASGEATIRTADPAAGFDGKLALRFEPLELTDSVLGPLLGPTPSLAGTVAFGADDSLRLTDLTVTTASGQLAGDLSLDLAAGSIAGQLTAELPALGKLEPLAGIPLAGSGRLAATLSGPLADPTAKGHLTLRQASIGPAQAIDLEADYSVETLVGAPHGRAEIRARGEPAAGEPLEIEIATGFALAEDRLQLDEITLDTEGVRAAGSLMAPLSGAPLTGEITAELSDPAGLLALIGIEAAGQGTLKAALSANGGRQALEATAELARLRYGPAGEPQATAASARLTARLDHLPGLAVSALDARLTEVRAGGATLDQLTLEASGDTSGARFSLATAGQFQGDFSLKADGTLGLAADRTELALTRLEGEVLGEPIRLLSPGALAFGERILEARELALGFGPASLTLDGRLANGRVEARITARDFPLALARLALPDNEIEGKLELEASLSGAAARPSGSFQARASDIQLGKDFGAPPLDLRLDGRLEAGRLTTRADLSGFSAEAAAAELVAPLRLSAEPVGFELPPDEPISGYARWSGELAQVWPLVPLVGHAASGTTEVDARLEGSFADPLIRGGATISGGSYENFETGTIVRDLELEARFDGETLTLARLTGGDGGVGSLDATGSLTMDPGGNFPVAAKLVLDRFTAMRRDDLTGAASGELGFSGDMSDSLLEGSLTTAGVVIQIPDTLPPEIVDLKVIEKGPEGEIDARRERARAEQDSDVRLAITVEMPNRVFVRGRGLETEWKGRLQVSGTAARPVVQGELSNLRGSLSVIGKRFNLVDSKIRFAGTDELVPLLDIRATHAANDVTVVANVTGTPDAPELTLTSTPELPRDEVLSRVLFGKTTTQLSPVQAIQLASAASELSGGIGASGVLDRARGLLGVDVLDVEETQGAEDGQTGAALSAGKYVTDNVFVGVKQGTTPGSSSVGVEVELTDEISIESGVGSSGESKLGVKFEWDY